MFGVWLSYRGVMANVLDSDIIVNEFECESCHLFHFQTNTLGKGMNFFIPPLPAID